MDLENNNVIGYKGTALERAENWITLIELRKSINYLKDNVIKNPRFEKGIDRETNIYNRFFKEYISSNKEAA